MQRAPQGCAETSTPSECSTRCFESFTWMADCAAVVSCPIRSAELCRVDSTYADKENPLLQTRFRRPEQGTAEVAVVSDSGQNHAAPSFSLRMYAKANPTASNGRHHVFTRLTHGRFRFQRSATASVARVYAEVAKENLEEAQMGISKRKARQNPAGT